MDREEIMERVAEYFGISPDYDDDGNEYYDIDSYDWQAGCSMGFGGKWLNLAEVIYCIEQMF